MRAEIPGCYEVLRGRRSVRRYSSRPVEEDKLARIMETGRLSASAANRQPWKFFLLRGRRRESFGLLLREHFRRAPVLIVACARPGEGWVRRHDGRNFAWLDVGIAVAEMVLAATAEGLGTCWIASFDPDEAGRVLDLPKGLEAVTAVALGYPEEAPGGERTRKSMEEVWELH